MLSRPHLLLLVLGCGLVASSAVADDAAPWDAPFAEDTDALLAAAQAVDAKDRASGLVLLTEAVYRFDENGHMTRITRVVARVLDQDGVREWGAVGATWSPWHEDAAQVRGRVVNADGSVHELDSSTLMERRLGGEVDIYWDRRVIEGPMPAIDVGSVVETQVSVEQHRPLFDAGTVTRQFLVGTSVPEVRRLVLEHPKSLKVHVASEEIGNPTKTTRDGILRRVWEVSPGPSLDDFDVWLPADEAQYPMVGFSTAKSWKDVARSYSDIVDERLEGTDLHEMAAEVVGEAAADRDRSAQRLLEWVQTEVRYTGLELGENALIPVPPMETLERGFGDCKDQSTLLVGMLRTLGHPAHVALLSSTGRRDSHADLPGLGNFDHAIVVVDGDEPMWIDPTSRYARAGHVVPLIQGRLALIASSKTRDLVNIDGSPPEANGWVETRAFTIEDEGQASLVEHTEYRGWPEATIREGYVGTTQTRRHEFLEGYLQDAYEGATLGEMVISDPADMSGLFSIHLEATEVGLAWSEDDEAYARFPFGSLLREIDPWFMTAPDPGTPERTADSSFYGGYQATLQYDVTPPPGYVLAERPEDAQVAAGPLSFSRAYLEGEDGQLQVRFDITMEARRIPPEELTSLREALGELNTEEPPWARFVHQAHQKFQAGDYAAAIVAAREGSASSTRQSALADTRLAEYLLAAGAGEAARVSATRATQTDPELVRAWRTLGWISQHDELGRRFSPGWDRAGSIAAYERALGASETDWVARADLSIVLETDAAGRRYGSTTGMTAAVDHLQTLREQWDLPTFEDNLLVDLFRLGRLDELGELADKIGTEGTRSLQVASATLAGGSEGALREARRHSSTDAERAELIVAAYSDLFAIGAFGPAADILEYLGRDQPKNEQGNAVIRMLRGAHEHETPEKAKTAVDAVELWFVALMNPRTTLADAEELLTATTHALLTEERLEELKTGMSSALASTMEEHSLSPEAASEMMLASMTMTDEGIEPKLRAVHIDVGLPGMGSGAKDVMITAKEKGHWRVAGGGEGWWDSIGFEAGARVDKDEDLARTLLQFAGASVVTDTSVEIMLFKAAIRMDGKGAVGLAAAALACTRPTPECLAEIEERVDVLEDDEGRGLALSTLASGYNTVRDYSGVERAARRLMEVYETPSRAGATLARALSRQGRRAEAETLVSELLVDADEGTTMDLRLVDAEIKADLAAAIAAMTEMDESSGVPIFANNRAWYEAVLGEVDEETLERARVASMSGSATALHTLATIYAELEQPVDARDALLRSMAAGERQRPDSDDWYVIGRVAELYGATEAAALAYGRVDPPAWEGKFDATRLLADRRLEAMAAGK